MLLTPLFCFQRVDIKVFLLLSTFTTSASVIKEDMCLILPQDEISFAIVSSHSRMLISQESVGKRLPTGKWFQPDTVDSTIVQC